MVKALEKARAQAKNRFEELYEGVCTVIERRQVKDTHTKIKQTKEIIVLDGQPCRLSFEKASAALQTETAAKKSQEIKLFLPSEVVIKPGSKVIVEQNGIRGEYSASGVPKTYQTHQEIMLELFERWL